MKTLPWLILCLIASALLSFGQTIDTNSVSTAISPRQVTENIPQRIKFDLDFKGGTPQELIDAIGLARGKPVNAIIPSDARDQKLPAFKVKNVDVAELFSAMLRASFKRNSEPTGYVYNEQFGFVAEGKQTDDSVWYFQVDKGHPPQAQRICRFYLLTPYLDAGLSVDDISTSIQAGWKMLGDSDIPQISFHKDTKLLIAVGPGDKVLMIDDLLRALTPPQKTPVASEKH